MADYLKYHILALYRSQYLWATVQFLIYAPLVTFLYTTKIGDSFGEMVRIGFIATLPSISLVQSGANVFGWLFGGFFTFHIVPRSPMRKYYYLILPLCALLATLISCFAVFYGAKFASYDAQYQALFLLSLIAASITAFWIYLENLTKNVSPIKINAFSLSIQKAETKSGLSNVLAVIISIAFVEFTFYLFASQYFVFWLGLGITYCIVVVVVVCLKIKQLKLELHSKRDAMSLKMKN